MNIDEHYQYCIIPLTDDGGDPHVFASFTEMRDGEAAVAMMNHSRLGRVVLLDTGDWGWE